jgi:hypothetical protein
VDLLRVQAQRLPDPRLDREAGHRHLRPPLAFLMAGYQRVFWLYGPLFGLIMVVGLGGIVRNTRHPGRGFSISRRRDGPTMMPWAAAVVLLVVPIAIADFDYRYLLAVVSFACLAASLASHPRPCARARRSRSHPALKPCRGRGRRLRLECSGSCSSAADRQVRM